MTFGENPFGLLDDHATVECGLELGHALLQFGTTLGQRGRLDIVQVLSARIRCSVGQARISVTDIGWFRKAP